MPLMQRMILTRSRQILDDGNASISAKEREIARTRSCARFLFALQLCDRNISAGFTITACSSLLNPSAQPLDTLSGLTRNTYRPNALHSTLTQDSSQQPLVIHTNSPEPSVVPKSSSPLWKKTPQHESPCGEVPSGLWRFTTMPAPP